MEMESVARLALLCIACKNTHLEQEIFDKIANIEIIPIAFQHKTFR